MSEWKKLAVTWAASILVGFYNVFILMKVWNWFVVPLLHVSEASYWLMFGASMLPWLITGADNQQENPVHEQRWKTLLIAVDACLPEHKAEEVREEARSEAEGIWTEIRRLIFVKVVSRSFMLGGAFAVHLLM